MNGFNACDYQFFILCTTTLLYVVSVGTVLLRTNGDAGTFAADHTFRLANYFQDRMVLEADIPGSVLWGYGKPGAEVEIELLGDILLTGINDEGLWKQSLWAGIPTGPWDIDVYQSERGNYTGHVVLRDVYFGDVFLCVGEANMAFPVAKMFNASEELAASSEFPLIRLMRISPDSSFSALPEPRILQNWTIATPDSLKDFSALCWATGRRVSEDIRSRFGQKAPIGLIGAYRDAASPIRGWIPPNSIGHCTGTMQQPGTDSVLWNAMIAPIKTLRFTSVIWYQGESDAALDADTYGCLFKAMVEGWRGNFFREFFGIVQLGTRNSEDVPGATAQIRWEQTAEYGQVPNEALILVFMASAMDLADPESPFGSELPRYKEEIAQRLLAGIVSVLYYRHIPFQGPFPKRIQLGPDNASLCIEYDQQINFTPNAASNFEICCDTPIFRTDNWKDCRIWHNTTSRPSLSAGNTIVVSTPCAGNASASFVQYAWAVTPCGYKNCQVYATDYLGDPKGLPGPPFVLPTNWTRDDYNLV
ncbi:sialate O-acetylesterase-like [Paramacrobiotus metropolitanus]|uniref:sialate O-acetylesterase-like n=1 Tax=Paramacrobiotus metropolitanus TaxID=2943436 RepID=UPI00244616E3|nr:sialate O-acetylesterase-like [Paramacrobiotus metropolitanus]